jgi:hypothetical protein
MFSVTICYEGANFFSVLYEESVPTIALINQRLSTCQMKLENRFQWIRKNDLLWHGRTLQEPVTTHLTSRNDRLRAVLDTVGSRICQGLGTVSSTEGPLEWNGWIKTFTVNHCSTQCDTEWSSDPGRMTKKSSSTTLKALPTTGAVTRWLLPGTCSSFQSSKSIAVFCTVRMQYRISADATSWFNCIWSNRFLVQIICQHNVEHISLKWPKFCLIWHLYLKSGCLPIHWSLGGLVACYWVISLSHARTHIYV